MSDQRRDDDGREARFTSPDLTRRILRATSGSACHRAEALLLARSEGALAAMDLALLKGHLARCEACRALSAALDWSVPLLPALAARDPGPGFTRAVLRRTSLARRRSPVARLERGAVALQDRWRRAWQRPRIALEAAWVGACAVAVLVFSPLAPRSAEQQALAVIRAGGAAVPGLVQDAPELGDQLVARLGEPASRIEVELGATAQGLRERAMAVVARGHSLWRDLSGGAQQIDSGATGRP